MTHLISPWVFYWIGVFGALEGFSLLLIIISTLFITMVGLFTLISENQYKTLRLLKLKRTWVLFGIALILYTFTPSEKTMYTMLVVDQITVENIGTLKQSTTELVDYVIEKVDILLEEEKGDK